MIPKEDLEKITKEAIILNGKSIVQNFENDLIIMRKVIEDLFKIISEPKYKDQIEPFMLARAYGGHSFAELSLVNDLVYMDGFGDICSVKDINVSKDGLQNIKDSVLAYLNILRTDSYYDESGLEIIKSSFLKRFDFHGYEFRVRIFFNGEFDFTIRW